MNIQTTNLTVRATLIAATAAAMLSLKPYRAPGTLSTGTGSSGSGSAGGTLSTTSGSGSSEGKRFGFGHRRSRRFGLGEYRHGYRHRDRYG